MESFYINRLQDRGFLGWIGCVAFAASTFISLSYVGDVAAQPKVDSEVAELLRTRPGLLYRYYDDEGSMNMGAHIPPKFIRNGFEMIDRYGQVVHKVERALSDEEKANLEAEQLEELARENSRKERREKDLLLLKTFSNPEDAERARDRKIAAIDVIIDITKGNLSRLESEFENEQLVAAGYEREGQAIPEEVFQRLDFLQQQIDDALAFVQKKEQEKDAVREDYAGDIIRLKELR